MFGGKAKYLPIPARPAGGFAPLRNTDERRKTMKSELSGLVRLEKSQLEPAAAMAARAFQDSPLSVHFFPDASERKDKLPYIFQFMIGYGLLYGEAYAISPNLEGVAVWLPSEKARMTRRGDIGSEGLSRLLKVEKETAAKWNSFDDYVASLHKRHVPFPHWYLQLLGIAPAYQGKGYAGTLLKAMFTRIDKERLPCFLETDKKRNVSLYQHYGFKVVEEGIVPGSEVTIWAMLRKND
jgi:ribosomal protein S18 acetylase RimI-like enzyme